MRAFLYHWPKGNGRLNGFWKLISFFPLFGSTEQGSIFGWATALSAGCLVELLPAHHSFLLICWFITVANFQGAFSLLSVFLLRIRDMVLLKFPTIKNHFNVGCPPIKSSDSVSFVLFIFYKCSKNMTLIFKFLLFCFKNGRMQYFHASETIGFAASWLISCMSSWKTSFMIHILRHLSNPELEESHELCWADVSVLTSLPPLWLLMEI